MVLQKEFSLLLKSSPLFFEEVTYLHTKLENSDGVIVLNVTYKQFSGIKNLMFCLYGADI